MISSRYTAAVILVTIVAAILCACTADTGSTDEHGLLPHLHVDLQLPADLSPGATGQFRIAVSQNGQPVQADRVVFEFWPEEDSGRLVRIVGKSEGDGLYAAEYRLQGEGVYAVRSRVSAGPLEAMPARRFAVGDEAVRRLEALEQEQLSGVPVDGGGHHHH